MRRSLLLMVLAVLVWAGAARAEIFGIGGGLAAYAVRLEDVKAQLAELDAPPGDLAVIPDLLPLPHLGLRGRLGLPIPISAQLEVAQLGLNLPVGGEMELSLGVASTVISFSLLGELKVLFLGLALGVGTDLIQGRLDSSSEDPQTEAILENLGLDRLPWSAATVHGLGELHLILGPLRLYLAGKYLYPLSGSGLGVGLWEASLGLMIVI